MQEEGINSHSPENTSEDDDISKENSEYSPFDPEKAKELAMQANISEPAEEISGYKPKHEKPLEADVAERSLEAEAEYNFKNADRYQETTFVLAAADSLVRSPDISYIDNIAQKIGDKAAENNTSVFEALKQSVQESDANKRGGWAATDLMNAFIDTTSTYAISKDEKIGRGFAKGLLVNLEMRIDGFTADKPNPHLDALRVDLSIIKPLADEFIKGYDTSYDSPNAFRDYLKDELEMREIDMRSAKRRGEQISPDVIRETQAINSAIAKLETLQSSYDKNLKNLQDTAHINHRVLK